MVNLCATCFGATTGTQVRVGDCALIFGMVVDIVANPACECPCHDGHACVMPRRFNGKGFDRPAPAGGNP